MNKGYDMPMLAEVCDRFAVSIDRSERPNSGCQFSPAPIGEMGVTLDRTLWVSPTCSHRGADFIAGALHEVGHIVFLYPSCDSRTTIDARMAADERVIFVWEIAVLRALQLPLAPYLESWYVQDTAVYCPNSGDLPADSRPI